jgi:hypothetical protein
MIFQGPPKAIASRTRYGVRIFTKQAPILDAGGACGLWVGDCLGWIHSGLAVRLWPLVSVY